MNFFRRETKIFCTDGSLNPPYKNMTTFVKLKADTFKK